MHKSNKQRQVCMYVRSTRQTDMKTKHVACMRTASLTGPIYGMPSLLYPTLRDTVPPPGTAVPNAATPRHGSGPQPDAASPREPNNKTVSSWGRGDGEKRLRLFIYTWRVHNASLPLRHRLDTYSSRYILTSSKMKNKSLLMAIFQQ